MSKTKRGRVFQAFKAAVLEQAMIVPGDRVLAACSGGPDSVALVRLLLELREEMPLEIVIAHFNHQIRAEAGADKAFVAELARRSVLPFVSGSKNVRREAAKRNLNLEETARVLRYEFLRDAARKTGATKIATGHNMNDQADTLLMRLFRGAGLPGLAGIAPVSGPAACPVIRPLLGVRREEIEAYLKAEKLEFRTDASNLDRRLLRNRIRLGLLPEIEKNYQAKAVEHLARLAALIREEDDLLSGFIRELAEEFILRTKGEASLDVRTLALVPPALARRVAREFIREIKGDLRAVSFENIESLLALREGKELTVRKGVALRREGGRLVRVRRAPAARPFDKSWDGRGELKVGGMTFRGKTADRPAGFLSRGDDRRRVVLDRDKLAFPLVVRSRRPGDLYRPVGAPGRKKLKEILRAKGISRSDRDRLPVFLAGGEIAWVPGLPAAEKFKVDAATKRLFSIEKIGGGRRTQRR